MSKDKFKVYYKNSRSDGWYTNAAQFETFEEAQKFQAERDDYLTDSRIDCLFDTGEELTEASLVNFGGRGLSLFLCDGGDGGACRLDNLIDFLASAFPDKLKAALERNNDDN